MFRVQSWTSAAINQNFTQVSPTSHLLSAWLCSKFCIQICNCAFEFPPSPYSLAALFVRSMSGAGHRCPILRLLQLIRQGNHKYKYKHSYKCKHKQEYKPEYTHKYTWPADAPPAISARQSWLQIQIQLQTQTQMWFSKSQLVNSVFLVVPFLTWKERTLTGE